MQDEFGVDTGDLTDRISQSASAYTRFSERIERMLGMGTDGSSAAIAAAASAVGDHVRADQRMTEIAQRVASNLGGPNVPAALVKEFAATLPGFVSEQNGTRTKLMELQAAFVDVKDGKLTDVDAYLRDLSTRYGSIPTLAPGPVNGSEPME
jgi:hypothetical protein